MHSFPRFFSLFIVLFFKLPLLLSQDSYHSELLDQLQNEYGINGGEWVISDSEVSTLQAYYAVDSVQVEQKDVLDMPFTKSLELTTYTRPDNFWEYAIQFNASQSIEESDVLLLVFWVRGIQGERGHGFINHTFELADAPYTSSIAQQQAPTESWQQWMLPFEAALDMSSSWYKIHLGFQAQQLEIGGVAVLNYGNSYELGDLPRSDHDLDYEGRDPDASWRIDAQNRIEEYRMEDLCIRVVDTEGNPVENAEVSIDMQKHAFGFGSSIYVPERALNQFGHSQDDLDQYYGTFEDLDGVGHGFNWATIDDELRWSTWENPYWPGDGQQHTLDHFEWLKERDIQVRGHMLVWPAFEWLPEDIENNQNDTAYIRQRINDHIEAIVGHPQLAGRVVDWNVINEPAHLFDMENIFGGREEYAEWFKLAAQTDPDAKLYINEYSILSSSGMDLKTQELYKEIIEEIDANGGQVDGVGLEAHMGYPLTPPELVYEIIDEYADLGNGKEISISEYDALGVDAFMAGEYMRDFLTITFSHPAMKSFLMWGYWDENHWLGDAPLFQDDWTLKPSGAEFIDLVFNQWWTNEQGTTDNLGEIKVPGFLGDYLITVQANGNTTQTQVSLEKDLGVFEIVHGPTSSTEPEAPGVILEQNIPNPFVGTTQIAFTLPVADEVRLSICDMLGREVAVLQYGRLAAGRHVVSYQPDTESPGIYTCRLQTGTGVFIKSMQLIR